MLSVAEKEDDYQDIFNSLGGFGSGIDEENNGKVKEDGDEDDSNCLAQLLTTRVRAAFEAFNKTSPNFVTFCILNFLYKVIEYSL